jgi:23S rRNA (uracil1939-C5)-methyltransferase
VRIVEGAPLGYRHRARLAVRGRAQSPKVGIFQEASHRIADIPRCPVHHPRINEIAAALRAAIRATATPPYADRSHGGLLRYVQIAIERATQTAQVVLVTRDTDPQSVMPLADALHAALPAALHSVWWNGQPERSNAILGPRWHHFRGPESVCETLEAVRIHFLPGAFGQANLPLFERLAARAREWVPEAQRVLELYAGCGVISLPLLPRAASLRLHERAPHAVRGIELALAERPEVERARATVLAGDAGADARLRSACTDADVIVADPPRRGLDAPLLEMLTESPPERLIYVSCGLPSFLAQARALLAGRKLRLAALEAWALFPQTNHVEILARFDRT